MAWYSVFVWPVGEEKAYYDDEMRAKGPCEAIVKLARRHRVRVIDKAMVRPLGQFEERYWYERGKAVWGLPVEMVSQVVRCEVPEVPCDGWLEAVVCEGLVRREGEVGVKACCSAACRRRALEELGCEECEEVVPCSEWDGWF
jgi:hypothetical protein